MKERPILFRPDLVLAILEGRKTVTRRIVRDTGLYAVDAQFHSDETAKREREALATRCPYGVPGDRLWVRERHARVPRPIEDRGDTGGWGPLFEDEAGGLKIRKWFPSIFLPRWASRLTLEVVSVRVERLQEITEEDAKIEGLFQNLAIGFPKGTPPIATARDNFRDLWDSINRKRAPWKSNPWVWVIGFRRVKP
jgi:hypothetical protein